MVDVPPKSFEHPRFPDTKYMGSKRALLPFILRHLLPLAPRRVLDAFAGSGCVAYALKERGIEVHTNDFLRFSYHTCHGAVANNSTLLTALDITRLLRHNRRAESFIQDTFGELYFDRTDNAFLDSLWANIQDIPSSLKRSLALAAGCRAAMKKRPRGIFTFTVRRDGMDG